MRSLSISSVMGSERAKHFCTKITLSMVRTGQWGAPPLGRSSEKMSATDSARRSKGICREQTSKNAVALGPPSSATVRSVNVGWALLRCIEHPCLKIQRPRRSPGSDEHRIKLRAGFSKASTPYAHNWGLRQTSSPSPKTHRNTPPSTQTVTPPSQLPYPPSFTSLPQKFVRVLVNFYLHFQKTTYILPNRGLTESFKFPQETARI